MTDIKKPKTVHLYLDKEGQTEVYIETSPLPQHQIDGIRFLYRQFKKNKPGVVLSNPVGFGKSIQVGLFLHAVCNSLTNPVLILCRDKNKVNNWKQTLIKWTRYNEDDIVVDSSNVYEKKMIFLKTGMTLEPPYTRRDWSVVVIKNDQAIASVVRTAIKATFKIWLTTTDIRKDLEMFNSIYGWLYLENRFDVIKYIASLSKVKGSVIQAKVLNAFLDDVVIIRNDITPTNNSEVILDEYSNTNQVSKKNKDATGTKIKRSKKTQETDTTTATIELIDYCDQPDPRQDESTANISTTPNIELNIEDSCDMNDYKNENVNNDGLDVESFIQQKDPVQCDEYEFLNESNSTDTENMSFTEALNDVVENENDETGDPKNNSESDFGSFNVDDDQDEVIMLSSDLDEQISSYVISTSSNKKKQRKNKNNSLVSAKSVTSNSTDREKTNSCTDSKTDGLTNTMPSNKNNRRDIDEVISQLEERVMKKFKGSFLDSFLSKKES